MNDDLQVLINEAAQDGLEWMMTYDSQEWPNGIGAGTAAADAAGRVMERLGKNFEQYYLLLRRSGMKRSSRQFAIESAQDESRYCKDHPIDYKWLRAMCAFTDLVEDEIKRRAAQLLPQLESDVASTHTHLRSVEGAYRAIRKQAKELKRTKNELADMYHRQFMRASHLSISIKYGDKEVECAS